MWYGGPELITCPFCGSGFFENADYIVVDEEVGSFEQMTPNYCNNCGAYEHGIREIVYDFQDYKDGWVQSRGIIPLANQVIIEEI